MGHERSKHNVGMRIGEHNVGMRIGEHNVERGVVGTTIRPERRDSDIA